MTTLARSRREIFDEVAAILRRAAGTEGPITERTELYYGLHLGGDDLSGVIEEIARTLGADFSRMDMRRYGPNEVGHNIFFLNVLRRHREWRGERTYRSLTVASLVDAVQAGAWDDG